MTYTHTRPAANSSFLAGFDSNANVVSQIRLFQAKTHDIDGNLIGSIVLDSALYSLAHQLRTGGGHSGPCDRIARALELPLWSPEVKPKADELACKLRELLERLGS